MPRSPDSANAALDLSTVVTRLLLKRVLEGAKGAQGCAERIPRAAVGDRRRTPMTFCLRRLDSLQCHGMRYRPDRSDDALNAAEMLLWWLAVGCELGACGGR